MSASPTNASLELTTQVTNLGADKASLTVSSPAPSSGHEALQALLAFSSLHDQIRQRRAREQRNDNGNGHGDGNGNGSRRNSRSDDTWKLEQFVLDEVLQLVAERALAITGADGLGIALAEGNEIICRASAGSIAPDAGARLDPNSGFSGACFRTGKIVRCDDSENDPRVNVQACRRLGTRSMVAVPLAGRHTVLGLVEAFSSEAYAFNDSDVRSLNLLAELILAAMRPEEEDRLSEISRRVADRADAPVAALEPSVSDDKKSTPLVIPVSSPVLAKADRSRPGLMVVLALVLLAAALGGGLWWKIHDTASGDANSTEAQSEPQSESGSVQSAASPNQTAAAAVGLAKPRVQTTASSSADDGKVQGLPQVTGIRHWSSDDSSTVVLDLQQQVQYEAHRLTEPDRIYFDLHDTAVAPGLSGKTIEVQDALLLRVRMAQPTPGVTRVVLETRAGSNYSVSLESNPYRLVVEVHGAGAKPRSQTKIDLFSPRIPAAKPSSVTASLRGDGARAVGHMPNLRIVLDAGHGGWDLGTVGRKGLMEKDLVLDIVDRVGSLLHKRLGAEVIYTREDDNYVALEKRAEIANLAQASLFMSVHANYSDDPLARGVETYYSNTYSSVKARTRDADAAGTLPQNVSWTNVDIREKVQGSRKIAASVQHELYGMLAAKNPGIRNRGVKEASYVVLTGTSMPAILAEVSFVSSPTDEKNLQSSAYRQQIAEALYKGLAAYAQTAHQDKMAHAEQPMPQAENGPSATLLVR